ncbi:hypothetical protein BGZ76_005315 [Entomortierella beljakovae]|nr:hypothetical protein BGZ76_005315 [Entomortierella beljakovae]
MPQAKTDADISSTEKRAFWDKEARECIALIQKTVKTPLLYCRNEIVDTTPTISVGVDFNIPEKVDYVVGFFNTHSGVSVETCHQMLRRARYVKEKTYLIHMKGRFSNLPTTEESLKEWLCDQDQMIRGGATDAQHLSYDGSASFKLNLRTTVHYLKDHQELVQE